MFSSTIAFALSRNIVGAGVTWNIAVYVQSSANGNALWSVSHETNSHHSSAVAVTVVPQIYNSFQLLVISVPSGATTSLISTVPSVSSLETIVTV